MLTTKWYDKYKYHLSDRRRNVRFRRKVIEKCIEDAGYKAALMRMCAEDPLFFVNVFAWTYAPVLYPDCPCQPFVTWEYQNKAIMDLVQAVGDHDVLIEKSRDMGASWILLVVFFWFWLFHREQSFLLVSRNEDYVDKPGNPKALFWKLDYLIEHLPVWMVPMYTRTKLRLTNNLNQSCIDGESTTGEVARGDRRTAIGLDEFASFETAAAYKALASTRDATKCRIFNSTPKGSANAFYDLAKRNHEIHKISLHWSLHPLKRIGLYKDSHGKLRSPWYDKECARTAHPVEIAQELDIDYAGSDYQFYPAELIDRLVRERASRPITIGDIEYDSYSGDPRRWVEQPKGLWRLWCNLGASREPPSDTSYAVSADVAEGTGASNSVLAIGNRETGEIVGKFVSSTVRPEDFAVLAVATARFFRGKDGQPALLGWEAAGPGRTFGARVIELGFRHIYYRRNEVAINPRYNTDIPGWWPTQDTKRDLHTEYRAALSEGKCINYDRDSLEECRQMIYTDRSLEHAESLRTVDPSGSSANHGDRPTADALCWKFMSERVRRTTRAPKPPRIPPGSLAWRRQEAAKEDRKKKKLSYWAK